MDDSSYFIVIPTAYKRTDLLIKRSLRSACTQTVRATGIVIVDDNNDHTEYFRVKKEVEIFTRENKCLEIPEIFVIRNSRTKGNSGTGSWNTTFDFIAKRHDQKLFFMALLDDDDEWDKSYLESVQKKIDTNTLGVFPNMVRIHKDFEFKYNLTLGDLTIRNFLRGNPGVQGSNIVIRSDIYEKIDGFDEGLCSTTDRDFMIRLLEKTCLNELAVVENVLAYHYANHSCSVTNNVDIKTKGLDQFYKKHIRKYSKEDLQYSLNRAKEYFSYENRDFVMDLYQSEQACQFS